MLESRVLDFETVIIVSVNEGVLPAGKTNNSFIPFDVKIENGLPTYKEKDADLYLSFLPSLTTCTKRPYNLQYRTRRSKWRGAESIFNPIRT